MKRKETEPEYFMLPCSLVEHLLEKVSDDNITEEVKELRLILQTSDSKQVSDRVPDQGQKHSDLVE